jgi:hypothetical protein
MNNFTHYLDTLVLPIKSKTDSPIKIDYGGNIVTLDGSYVKSLFGCQPIGIPWEVL